MITWHEAPVSECAVSPIFNESKAPGVDCMAISTCTRTCTCISRYSDRLQCKPKWKWADSRSVEKRHERWGEIIGCIERDSMRPRFSSIKVTGLLVTSSHLKYYNVLWGTSGSKLLLTSYSTLFCYIIIELMWQLHVWHCYAKPLNTAANYSIRYCYKPRSCFDRYTQIYEDQLVTVTHFHEGYRSSVYLQLDSMKTSEVVALCSHSLQGHPQV